MLSYWLFRFLAYLPLSWTYTLVRPLAWLIGDILRYRRQTVSDNLARALPEISESQRKAIAVAFYRQLVEMAFEIIRGHDMPLAVFRERVRITNPELIHKLSEQRSRSVVVLVIHQGNWEWMLHAASDVLAIPIDPVYKPLHSIGADRFMLELRSRFGGEPITAASAARDILRKRQQARLICILADQSPGQRERMHWSPMLNQPTAWFTGAAAIARLTRSPVAFAQCRRTSRGHYDMTFHEITRDPKALGEAGIIDAYATLAEQAILDDPSSYLWSNRRWKLNDDQPTVPPAASDTAGED